MNWINVKDRTPDNDDTVLVCDDEGGMDLAVYKVCVDETEPRFKYCFCCSEIRGNITHWMPLPEKPKEDE